jgi:hypothetical protein
VELRCSEIIWRSVPVTWDSADQPESTHFRFLSRKYQPSRPAMNDEAFNWFLELGILELARGDRAQQADAGPGDRRSRAAVRVAW